MFFESFLNSDILHNQAQQ